MDYLDGDEIAALLSRLGLPAGPLAGPLAAVRVAGDERMHLSGGSGRTRCGRDGGGRVYAASGLGAGRWCPRCAPERFGSEPAASWLRLVGDAGALLDQPAPRSADELVRLAVAAARLGDHLAWDRALQAGVGHSELVRTWDVRRGEWDRIMRDRLLFAAATVWPTGPERDLLVAVGVPSATMVRAVLRAGSEDLAGAVCRIECCGDAAYAGDRWVGPVSAAQRRWLDAHLPSQVEDLGEFHRGRDHGLAATVASLGTGMVDAARAVLADPGGR